MFFKYINCERIWKHLKFCFSQYLGSRAHPANHQNLSALDALVIEKSGELFSFFSSIAISIWI